MNQSSFRFLFAAFLALCSVATAASSEKPERAFYVKFRKKPLTGPEAQDLQRNGMNTLYWEVAEIETANDGWRFSRWPTAPERNRPELRIVAGVRISMQDASSLDPAKRGMLVDRVVEASEAANTNEVLLNWNVLPRYFGAYTEVLSLLKAKGLRVAITAQPSWVTDPGFAALATAASEMVVCFFDEEGPLAAGEPLVSATACSSLMQAWKVAAVKWQLGLPNFVRVGAYDIAGRLRGDIDAWVWNDFLTSDFLRYFGSPSPGVYQMKATLRGGFSRLRVEQDDLVTIRIPDRNELRALEEQSGTPAVYFRMPDATDRVAWSISQIAQLGGPSAKTPNLTVHFGSGLAVINTSDADLLPALSAQGNVHGYGLQIDAERPIFRRVLPGDFADVVMEGDLESSPKHSNKSGKGPLRLISTSLDSASRLTFVFPKLRAGEVLYVGALEFTPGSEMAPLRYRFVNVPGPSVWTDLKRE